MRLAPGDSPENWREITASEKTALEKSDAEWVRPPQAFIDKWNAATKGVNAILIKWDDIGCYNEETGFFELNGLTDIGYEEALLIWQYRQDMKAPGRINSAVAIRTNLLVNPWMHDPVYDQTVYPRSCFGSNRLKVIRLATSDRHYVSHQNAEALFLNGADNVEEIIGVLNLSQFTNRTYFKPFYEGGSKVLRKFLIMNLNHMIYLQNCPALSYESVRYMVDNAANTSAIMPRLHTSLLSALSGEAEYPFNGGTREEWLKLAEDATARNITFVN